MEEVLDPALEISLEDAEEIDSSLHIGDIAQCRYSPRNSDVLRHRTLKI